VYNLRLVVPVLLSLAGKVGNYAANLEPDSLASKLFHPDRVYINTPLCKCIRVERYKISSLTAAATSAADRGQKTKA
jgi:hypothetical protein